MANIQPYRFKTISQYHDIMGLPKPEHPLISVINLEQVRPPAVEGPMSVIFDFYSISIKRNTGGSYRYGQEQYDFNEGVMFFMAPGQVFGAGEGSDQESGWPSGWLLLIHPDFLWHTPLASGIRQYEYFDYSVREALYLSDREEATIIGIIRSIEQEYHSNIDKFSQDIIISQLEVLLSYSERFYHRQFLTRRISSHQVIDRLEALLTECFDSTDLAVKGLPSVQLIADSLNVSPNYLSSLLKAITGQSTQQHIHDKLIEKAKEKLSTTDLTVSEIAYTLGFEHSQSFSKLFKTKTKVSPLEFRASFN